MILILIVLFFCIKAVVFILLIFFLLIFLTEPRFMSYAPIWGSVNFSADTAASIKND
jgi:hypothetical protein